VVEKKANRAWDEWTNSSLDKVNRARACAHSALDKMPLVDTPKVKRCLTNNHRCRVEGKVPLTEPCEK
jgi:hypothetical protein